MGLETLIQEIKLTKINKSEKVVEPQVVGEKKAVEQSRADKFLNSFRAIRYTWESK